MTYSSTMIANNVLQRAFEEKILISPMKLQKILYFVASEYQKMTGATLLEEPFSTWAYGPVLYSVYDEFRSFKNNGINRYARDAKGKPFAIDESTDLSLRMALDFVWAHTKNKNAIALSEITHKPDSAWDKAFQSKALTLNISDVADDITYREPLGMFTSTAAPEERG